ncbi:hypothetical protein ACFXB3_09595 [Streptomyces sp. NPDC059447]|uniref:hypothetical protein n=1 Tax=Streptomyces sp. NPDC059447 TaxID=3346834 RepID=UPI0036A254E7
MTESIDAAQADRALKAKHRAMWAMGDYPSVASHLIPDLGAVLVRECGVSRGDRVLDVATGARKPGQTRPPGRRHRGG